jgi:hypothetical protein
MGPLVWFDRQSGEDRTLVVFPGVVLAVFASVCVVPLRMLPIRLRRNAGLRRWGPRWARTAVLERDFTDTPPVRRSSSD